MPKLLLEWVEHTRGSQAASRIRRRAGCPADRIFRITELCTDEEWQRVLSAAVEELGCTPTALDDGFAKAFITDARQRFPMWFKMSKTAREFLERQPAIHNNFASGVQDAESRQGIVDKFRIEKLDRELVTHYHSPNLHCHLYESLANEVLRVYGESAVIEHRLCMKKGDPECEIHIRWPKDSE
jgi:hypothetical protein